MRRNRSIGTAVDAHDGCIRPTGRRGVRILEERRRGIPLAVVKDHVHQSQAVALVRLRKNAGNWCVLWKVRRLPKFRVRWPEDHTAVAWTRWIQHQADEALSSFQRLCSLHRVPCFSHVVRGVGLEVHPRHIGSHAAEYASGEAAVKGLALTHRPDFHAGKLDLDKVVAGA